jgi:hypothetical protein
MAYFGWVSADKVETLQKLNLQLQKSNEMLVYLKANQILTDSNLISLNSKFARVIDQVKYTLSLLNTQDKRCMAGLTDALLKLETLKGEVEALNAATQETNANVDFIFKAVKYLCALTYNMDVVEFVDNTEKAVSVQASSSSVSSGSSASSSSP